MSSELSDVNEKEVLGKAKERFSRARILELFKATRSFTEHIVKPLEIEDFVIQAMNNTSPTKWHLAHTSWFFETFVLGKYQEAFKSLHPQYAYLFNSYYLQTGVPFARAGRGMLSRPTVKEVLEYRAYVNEHVELFINSVSDKDWQEASQVIEIGINHEQQHQELIITDFKFLLAQNPLMPVYKAGKEISAKDPGELTWTNFKEAVVEIGNEGGEFTYDNEHPQHRSLVQDFAIANRLITNKEYLEFINDGGYTRSEFWLNEGWYKVQNEQWIAPLYWFKRDGEWTQFTLSGARKVANYEPVTHISYYEADAFSKWKGLRLPTEQEWEHACGDLPIQGNFIDDDVIHPVPLQGAQEGLRQMYGDAWEWTQSSYNAYPGYAPLPGALGEYNGKFMANQYVLRGGSCVTSKSHIRKTYRNFFHADARWQFSGIRLAK